MQIMSGVKMRSSISTLPKAVPVIIVLLLVCAIVPSLRAEDLDQQEVVSAADIRKIELIDRRTTAGLVLENDLDISLRILQEQRSDIGIHLSGEIESNREVCIPEFTVEESANTCQIELTGCDGPQLFLRISGTAVLTLFVPTAWQGELYAKTGSASIDTGDLRLTSLECRTSSGRLSVDSIEAERVQLRASSGSLGVGEIRAEQAVLRTASGNMNVEILDMEQAELRSSSGDQRVEYVSGDIKARASSGDIWLDFQGLEGEVDAETSSGSITVLNVSERTRLHSSSGNVEAELREDTSCDLSISTSSGDIDVDFPITVSGQMDEDRVEGTIGDGGPLIEIETSSGDVTVRKPR